MTNPAISYTKSELADMVWLRTGKVPQHIRTQACWVIGEFADGSLSVHRIEDLERINPS